jgi:hypothetical protein
MQEAAMNETVKRRITARRSFFIFKGFWLPKINHFTSISHSLAHLRAYNVAKGCFSTFAHDRTVTPRFFKPTFII